MTIYIYCIYMYRYIYKVCVVSVGDILWELHSRNKFLLHLTYKKNVHYIGRIFGKVYICPIFLSLEVIYKLIV